MRDQFSGGMERAHGDLCGSRTNRLNRQSGGWRSGSSFEVVSCQMVRWPTRYNRGRLGDVPVTRHHPEWVSNTVEHREEEGERG